MRTRRFVHAAVSSLSVVLLLAAHPARAQLAPQVPLKGISIPKYVAPLPALETIVDDGITPIELHAREFKTQVLPAGFPPTTVWGYLVADRATGQLPASRDSYVGPLIVATRRHPTTVKLVNELGSASTTALRAWRDSTDPTIHWADPLAWANPSLPVNECSHMVMPPAPGTSCALNYSGPVPAALHLHGGEVPPELDGGPDAWVTSDGAIRGPAF
jgi:FtsP/CotA-like multicopper oxidase with cupredoxin domain